MRLLLKTRIDCSALKMLFKNQAESDSRSFSLPSPAPPFQKNKSESCVRSPLLSVLRENAQTPSACWRTPAKQRCVLAAALGNPGAREPERGQSRRAPRALSGSLAAGPGLRGSWQPFSSCKQQADVTQAAVTADPLQSSPGGSGVEDRALVAFWHA